MDWWVALIPLLLSIGVIYFTLFQALRYLFQNHPFWFVAMIILIAPFGFIIAQVSSLLDLAWVLTLTPFYGVFVLLLAFTTWMIRFYCSAYAILILADFLLQRAFVKTRIQSESFEPFWQKHLKTLSTNKETRIAQSFRRIINSISLSTKKYWTLAVAVALVLVVASTLVSACVQRNPTYIEAVQFATFDKTDQHSYVVGEYTCADFSADFQANAIKTGLNCGYVTVFFPDETKHALNCFNTTDRGAVYFEPQTDEVVALVVGEIYVGAAWNLQVQNATVVGFSVDWRP